jgi:hypothetical protein
MRELQSAWRGIERFGFRLLIFDVSPAEHNVSSTHHQLMGVMGPPPGIGTHRIPRLSTTLRFDQLRPDSLQQCAESWGEALFATKNVRSGMQAAS